MDGCPDLRTLRVLLANTLSQAELSRVESHLEHCAECQQRLDALTADASSALFAALPVTVERSRPAGLLRVAGYEIHEEAGCGGHGVVFRARHLGLDRQVALKVLRAGEFATADERNRFLEEAKAAAHLTHPNIVAVYDIGTTAEETPYFAMEWVAGGTLASRLQTAPLKPADAANLVETLALAVQHAHEAGIIHRDLKPANILLPWAGPPGLPRTPLLPKIADFGLAKIAALNPACLTPTVAVFGTPAYMAPEQACGRSREVGPTADVYSLGVILYECLTGRPPFQAETAYETLLLVRDHEPVPLRSLVPSLPRDLETICLKCLNKDPLHRYLTAADLAADLARHRAGEPIKARATGSLEKFARWGKRHPREAALAGLLAVALLAGFAALTSLWLIAEARGRAARDEKARAEKLLEQSRGVIKDYFIKVSENQQLQSPSMQSLREDLLLAAREHLETIVQTTQDNTVALELSENYSRLYHLYKFQGERAKAREASQLCLALRERLMAEDPSNQLYRDKFAIALENHGAASTREDPTESAELIRRSLEVREQLYRDHKGNSKYLDDVITSRFNLAVGHYNANRLADAEPHLVAAIALGDSANLSGEDYRFRMLADCRELLGAIQAKTNRQREGLKAVRAALVDLQRIKEPKRSLEGLAGCYAHLAEHLAGLGELTEAKASREKAIDLYLRLIEVVTATDPRVRDARQQLASLFRTLGREAEAKGMERLLSGR